MRNFILVLLIMLLIPITQPTQAQDDAEYCAALVDNTLEELATNCAGLPTNTACYGYGSIDTKVFDEFGNTIPEDFFTVLGDWSDLTQIEQFVTGGEDANEDVWGALVLYTQANIPLDSPPAAFMLMGNVAITNNVPPENAVDFAEEDGQLTPMQSFTLELGAENERCSEALTGLFIQTPENPDGDPVKFIANGIAFTAPTDPSSNIMISPGEAGSINFAVLSGSVTLFSDTEFPITVPVGYSLSLPVDEDGSIIPPQNAEEAAALQAAIVVIPQEKLEALVVLNKIPANILVNKLNLPVITYPSGVGNPEPIVRPGATQ